MTQGAPGALILSFSLPLMVGNIFQQCYTVVDTMIVGKALGVNALAAVGAADWLNWLVLGMICGFAQGFGILMSQEFGASNFDRLRKVVSLSAVLSVVFAVILLVTGQLAARPLLILLQTPDAVLNDALLYLRIIYAGIPVVMAYNFFSCILRSLGDGRTPLNAMIIASFINIVLDLVFVLVFHWGIAGAAAATVIAQLFSGIFCLYHISRIEILAVTRKDFTRDRRLSGHLVFLGLPMAMLNVLIAVGGMIIQFVVNGFGVLFIAGMTASNKIYGILEIAASSYGFAMITYTGQNLGAQKLDRIRTGTRSSVIISLVTSLIIAVLMIVFGKDLLRLFISGTPEEISETLRVAYHYLVVMSVFLPVLYVLYVIRSIIQGMGNTILPMVSGIAEFIMRTSCAFLLPALMGNSGIFYAEVAAWVGADVILIISYFIVMKKAAAYYDAPQRSAQ